MLWGVVLGDNEGGRKEVIGSKSYQFQNMNRSHASLGWACLNGKLMKSTCLMDFL